MKNAPATGILMQFLLLAGCAPVQFGSPPESGEYVTLHDRPICDSDTLCVGVIVCGFDPLKSYSRERCKENPQVVRYLRPGRYKVTVLCPIKTQTGYPMKVLSVDLRLPGPYAFSCDGARHMEEPVGA